MDPETKRERAATCRIGSNLYKYIYIYNPIFVYSLIYREIIVYLSGKVKTMIIFFLLIDLCVFKIYSIINIFYSKDIIKMIFKTPANRIIQQSFLKHPFPQGKITAKL